MCIVGDFSALHREGVFNILTFCLGDIHPYYNTPLFFQIIFLLFEEIFGLKKEKKTDARKSQNLKTEQKDNAKYPTFYHE